MNNITQPWWIFLVLLALLPFTFTRTAQAQETYDVAVLNMEGAQLDAAALATLTSVLRDEAAQNKRFNITQTPPVSISEVVVVLGCDPNEMHCLQQVAENLDTRLLIYGTATKNNDIHHLTVEIFDARSARILHAFARDFDSNQNLAISFRSEMTSFFAAPRSLPTTRLEISSNLAGADVRIDDVVVGTTPFERLGLPQGTYQVELSAPGFEPWTDTITLTDSGEVILKAQLTALEGYIPQASLNHQDEVGPATNWAAWSAISVGAVALGASGVLAWMMNDTEQQISDGLANNLTQREHQELLDKGESYQFSHRLLLGVGAVGVTSGLVWLLVDGLSNNDDEAALSHSPLQFGISPTSVSASWSW